MRPIAPGKHSAERAERDSRIYYYWLLLALFLEYARPASYWSVLHIPFLYSAIPILLLFASFFAHGLRPMRTVFADPMAKWIVIFVSLIAFCFVHAEVTLYVFNTFKAVLGYAILFILISRIVTTEARLRGVFVTLLLAHLFLLTMNPNVILNPETRNYIVGATFLGDGNDFALSLCVMIPLVVLVALHAKGVWPKALSWVGVVILLFAIVASQSRGATLGLGAVLIFLWLTSPRKGLTLLGLGFVVCVVLLYAPPEYYQRLHTIADYKSEGSAMGRVMAWKAGTRMALDNPVLGIGAGQFAVNFGTKYRPKEVFGNIPWVTAHSSYFLVLAELGFFGLFVFLTLVVGGFRFNQKVRSAVLARAGPDPDKTVVQTARILYLSSASMVGFAVAGAFLSAAYYPHIFVLTGLLISARDIAMTKAGIDVREVKLGSSRMGARTRRAATARRPANATDSAAR
jgi:putative inorganic carbon (hco3(-)) transporter